MDARAVNLIITDNIEVFNPLCLYGFVPMFNPERPSGYALLTGGFGQISSSVGGVRRITNREGTTEQVSATRPNISLTNANLVPEGGLPFLGCVVIVSTRRTYYLSPG